MKANSARFSNQDILKDEDWAMIAEEVKKKYPGMTAEQLNEAIMNGITGQYNETQPTINTFTIFMWLKKYWFNGSRMETNF